MYYCCKIGCIGHNNQYASCGEYSPRDSQHGYTCPNLPKIDPFPLREIDPCLPKLDIRKIKKYY